MSSIFSKIISGQLPASFLYLDAVISVFLDVHGVNPGHCLVVPNEEVVSLTELPEETGKHMFAVAHKIAKAYRSGVIECEGVNIWISDGEVAGQEIPHVHLHVVPRVKGDSLNIEHQSKAWDESRRSELEEIAIKIKTKI